MCRVNRQLQALAAAAIATLALTPLSADAATPSPSPSLDKVLAPPPSSDFAELTTGVLHGQFDAHDWATTNSTGSAATETRRRASASRPFATKRHAPRRLAADNSTARASRTAHSAETAR